MKYVRQTKAVSKSNYWYVKSDMKPTTKLQHTCTVTVQVDKTTTKTLCLKIDEHFTIAKVRAQLKFGLISFWFKRNYMTLYILGYVTHLVRIGRKLKWINISGSSLHVSTKKGLSNQEQQKREKHAKLQLPHSLLQKHPIKHSNSVA